ncbi:MAG TPA: AAA family ATPase [bacterium]|nr:AAA family ATPase [bacterium]
MIITLGGLPGAGKSTIKNLLAEELGLKKYSMGDMRGEMAKSRGLTIDELNDIGLNDASTDHEVDAFQKTLGETQDDFVIDGAMSWFFLPQSKKIYLAVDPKVAAERIFADRQNNPNRTDEPEYANVEATEQALAARAAQNDARYKKWYGAEYLNPKNYDFVIDTTHLSTDEVLQKILQYVQT